MAESTQILWTPAGQSLPSLGSKALVDIVDGDTPSFRMSIRMLSIDTPEVTAKSSAGAEKIDNEFKQLAQWIKDGIAPVSKKFREHILPRLENSDPGTLQFTQGKSASAFHKKIVEERLTRPNSSKKRNLFIRTADSPFDNYNRLLAYVSPSYSRSERKEMTRRERATFNLNMVESGWAAPFVLFPSIPGELDLPLFLETAEFARQNKKGQYQDDHSLPGYEYRMCEKLHNITKRIVEGGDLSYPEKIAWRTRYCADIRNRELFGPEDYFHIPQPYRLWIWPDDIQKAIGSLNLVPK